MEPLNPFTIAKFFLYLYHLVRTAGMFSFGNIFPASAGEITSGFRIDFVEVRLDGFEPVRELQIDISGMQGGEAELFGN